MGNVLQIAGLVLLIFGFFLNLRGHRIASFCLDFGCFGLGLGTLLKEMTRHPVLFWLGVGLVILAAIDIIRHAYFAYVRRARP